MDKYINFYTKKFITFMHCFVNFIVAMNSLIFYFLLDKSLNLFRRFQALIFFLLVHPFISFFLFKSKLNSLASTVFLLLNLSIMFNTEQNIFLIYLLFLPVLQVSSYRELLYFVQKLQAAHNTLFIIFIINTLF